MRAWILVCGAIAACSNETKPAATSQQQPAQLRDAAPGPRLVTGPSTVVPNAQPTALLWIDASGALAVGETRGTNLSAAARAPVEPQRLRRAVLAAISDAGGPLAPLAKIDRDDLEQHADLTAPPDATDRRLAARVVALSTIDPTSPLVFVDPDAPATVLARVLVDTGGALAVPHTTELAIFDHAFNLTVDRVAVPEGWIEVHLDSTGIHLVGVPDRTDVELAATATDADWRSAFDRLSLGAPTKSVDVLVGNGPSAQALVDLVARLARLGVGDLAVGEARVTFDQRLREIESLRERSKGPQIRIGSVAEIPELGLGKEAIRATVRLARDKVRRCYEKRLLVDPNLRGTVTASFWLEPNGTVSDATATGMHSEVAACIADVIAALRFPKRRGTRVRVNFPFRFEGA